jgi:hypothetical protein
MKNGKVVNPYSSTPLKEQVASSIPEQGATHPSKTPTPSPTPVSDWGAYQKQFPGGKIPKGTKKWGVDPRDGKIKEFQF